MHASSNHGPAPLVVARSLRRIPCAIAILVWTGIAALAQPARTPPHIGYAYPAGGKAGTTVTVSVGGQNLNGTTAGYVSGATIAVTVLGYDRPLTQKEFSDLRDKAQALQEKRAAALGLPPPERLNAEAKKAAQAKKAAAEKDVDKPAAAPGSTPATATTDSPKPTWTPEDQKELADLRTLLMTKRPNRQGNPAIAETVTLELTIPPDAPVGDCELRLRTPAGLSNPMLLQVGDLPEYVTPVVTATNNPRPIPGRDPNARAVRPEGPPVEITLPVVVNGQIMPGQVDRYVFAATKGQHLTVAASARSLIPYLADAVPGWFQATLGLYDATGREVAYSDNFRFTPDPVVSYEIPVDGRYTIEIKDSIYRGREDFVYRVAVGELPFVTSVFPLGGKVTDPATFELAGWNLPGNKLTVDTKDRTPGTFLLAVRNRGALSNAVRFKLDSQPSAREVEPNDSAANAQRVTLPVIVDGRIDRPADQDVFRFDGKAGDEIVAEVYARRLGSPLDSTLTVTDASGRQIAFNDDHEDKGAGLITHQADSRVSTKLPATGTYFVRIADAQRNGGPDYAYRLRIGPPQPDFELRVVPSSINARPGTHVPLTVYALRRDGFDGEIALALQDGPRGYWLSGARIPPGQDKVQVTLGISPNVGTELIPIVVIGAAPIAGQPVAHAAVPADDMMQAFAYHHLVPARETLVDVTGRGGPNARLLTRAPVLLNAGGTTEVNISIIVPRGMGTLAVDLNDAPEGLTVKSTSVNGETATVLVACDAAKLKSGSKGNLILNAYAERSNPNAKGAAQRSQRIPLGSLPALPYEVITPAASK